ncbi:transcriptional repressor NrdR [Abditibacterium utsteinense]|uniref:Transcriptional repressor NrdR n=1 Tax=Abditibacterium utsteinense TaxID=1960156 RepID=A0A2S8SSF8_9BACT|nr:transcriptional regulator NrdR [Abditibacterium utsteinense]PQV63743.1 transcriptional repressor NrdR [Abditibacterium utsteinense]
MKCPFCHHVDTRVVDSRPVEDGAALRRRRGCEICGARFTTYERALSSALIIVKKDGRREEFSLGKLRGGLAKACNKRPVATENIARSAEEIEAQLRRDGALEVTSERIGELVMEKLFVLDQVAYVRFASVYQRFDDVKRFAQLLERISRRGRGQHKPSKTEIQEPESEEI